MTVKSMDEWQRLSVKILQAAGTNASNAQTVAEALVKADLRGVHSHGLRLLPQYVKAIRNGELIPTAYPEIREESPTTALVSSNWTFGQVGARFAIKVAIAKANKHRVAVVSLVEANHIGRLGEYAEVAAEQGMVSMIFSGGYGVEKPVAVPYGGRRPVLSTNPLAMGFPAGKGPPVIIDYATTVVAGSKITQARDRKEFLPTDTIVDKDGNPTTNPLDFFEGGALLPFGGHKGYALMVATELWGRILTGADRFTKESRGGIVYGHTGTTMIVFKNDLFQTLEACQQQVDTLQKQIHAVPPATGFEEVLVPGDLEDQAERKQRRDGIALPEDTWKGLVVLLTELGLEDPCKNRTHERRMQ